MRHSPLDAVHRSLGAKMAPFGGWEMPIAYPLGTIEEHRSCRNAAVVFDVSHLGTVRVQGSGAFESLQRELTNDLSKIGPGRAQYTHLLDPADGSVEVIIPPGTQSHTRIAVPGHGVPRLQRSGRGDLGVTFIVKTPSKLDDTQRDLLRQLAEARQETQPEVAVSKQGRGVLGWLKEAFS